MAIETQEHPVQPVVLSAGQDHAAKSVVEKLKQTEGTKLLVLLEGLSGVGKDFVANSIKQEVDSVGGQVVGLERVRYYHKEFDNYEGHLVTTATPYEAQEVREKAEEDFPGRQIITITVPGMTQAEIGDYIDTLPEIDQATLSREDLVKYSLGVPYLAQQLAFPGIDAEMAPAIAGIYFYHNIRGSFKPEIRQAAAEQYLNVPLPEEVVQAIEEATSGYTIRTIYDRLYSVLDRQKSLREKQGVIHESPLFIAPESRAIYDSMLGSDKHTSIDIVVPELTHQELEQIKQALGLTSGKQDQYAPSRMKVFGATARKVSLWFKDDDQEFFDENEYYGGERKIAGYMDAHKLGNLSLKPRKNTTTASFFAHSHEHHDMVDNPTMLGWAVESLLQRLGIPYFVNNYLYGKAYTYNPDTKHIETLPETLDTSEWY